MPKAEFLVNYVLILEVVAMDDYNYYNLASQEEMDSLLDLALSSKTEDSSYALDEDSAESLDLD